ncbi:MAG: hypothetical protein ACRCUH_08855 [Shewanella sp.]
MKTILPYLQNIEFHMGEQVRMMTRISEALDKLAQIERVPSAVPVSPEMTAPELERFNAAYETLDEAIDAHNAHNAEKAEKVEKVVEPAPVVSITHDGLKDLCLEMFKVNEANKAIIRAFLTECGAKKVVELSAEDLVTVWGRVSALGATNDK